MAARASAAIGQRSLGDPSLLFPLYPPLLNGCPQTSSAEMQYPRDIDYDYSKISKDLFQQAPLPGIARWAPLLPPLTPNLSLGEGGTALIESTRLGCWIGLESPIRLKDESRNPTWSHKDRLNYCIVSAAVATGARGIAVASTGNHGASAAAYARRAGLRCVVISTPDAQPAFEHFQAALGSTFLRVSREDRWPALRRIVEETGFVSASNLTRFHTSNPFGPEGYKTIAYELFTQLGQVPGTVVLPPPVLLATCTRTGKSFSCSMMVTIWRAITSLPEPGPPCTTSSIGCVGVNCANAGAKAAETANIAAPAIKLRLFIAFLPYVFAILFCRKHPAYPSASARTRARLK